MSENTNNTVINYFNGKSLLINTPQGQIYGGISAWQGIRSLGSDIYLMCGTTDPTANTGSGLIYVGEINCQNDEVYYLYVPNSLGTSLYGPNYDNDTGIYTFVGSFLDYNQNTNGFIYQGTLDSLTNQSNFKYPAINQYFGINYLHSYSNGLFVGNSGNSNKANETVSYIYDINDLNNIKTLIKYPDALTTTTYGIWYNGNNNYTIVGGYSINAISIDKIYTNKGINPIGSAFIVDYNSVSNLFFNWTSISFGDNLLTHFQGISRSQNGTYSISADVLDLQVSPLPIGYFLRIDRNLNNSFLYNLSNAVKIVYDATGFASSNSVADNKIVGLYIGNDNTKISYQAEIINDTFISKSNTLMTTVKKDEVIRFDNTFTENNYINYENGVFTFLENGTYFISFNIYIENTKLPSITLSVEYKKKELFNRFFIAQKGIDEIGTGTAHSLVLPCSFINKFTINDTIRIRNTSEGSINFVSNYVENATNGIMSIYKIA